MATRKSNDEDDVSSANEAMGEEFRKALAEEKGEERKAERSKEIDVDEENDEEQAGEPQEERASRSERRRQRKSQFEEYRAKSAELDARLAERDRELAEMRGQLQGFLASQQRQTAPEQSQKSMEELAVEQAERAVYDIHQEFSSLAPEEQQRKLGEYQRKHVEAERKKDEARYKLFSSRNQPAPQRGPSQAEMYLNAQAADVMSHGDKGVIAVQTQFARLTKLRGKPDSLATLAEAVDLAREDLGIRRPAPSINHREPGLKEKLRAPGQGPQGGSGGDHGNRRVVRMGGNSSEEKARRQMAQAMYPKLPADKAYERYAKTVLKDQLEAGEIDS